jgi:putative endonuclease
MTQGRLFRRLYGILAGVAVYHVYILASPSAVLYTGVTNHLERRVAEHGQKLVSSFSKRYNITRLVYFEAFGDVRAAIAREKQLKRWRRDKKVALIEKLNPKWRDLSEDFHRS